MLFNRYLMLGLKTYLAADARLSVGNESRLSALDARNTVKYSRAASPTPNHIPTSFSAAA